MIPVGLLRFAPWAIAGLAVLAALWFRGEYHDERAARAADRAAAEQAKAAALEDAQRRSDAIVTEQARAIADTAARAATVRERIAYVPAASSCINSPAVRLGADGMRAILGAGGGSTPAK
jgi:hypothetical protein